MYESRRSIIRDETSNGVRAGLLFDPKNLADAKSGFGRAPDISAKSIFNRAIFQGLNLVYVLLPISSRETVFPSFWISD